MIQLKDLILEQGTNDPAEGPRSRTRNERFKKGTSPTLVATRQMCKSPTDHGFNNTSS